MSEGQANEELEKKDGRKRILLVDDDREIVESMRIALEASGYEIIVARDGNQGLALAEREDPDLVILDMMMPKRSGFLVLEKLRRTRPVPLANRHAMGYQYRVSSREEFGRLCTRGSCVMVEEKSMVDTPTKVGKRILLVDDDREIVESMRITLESAGYEIIVARDGNQGLALAEREDPDLVILDMMMPKRSGFLVLEKLRRTRPVPLRIIMVTANEGSRHKAYAEMLGVDDYIRKPFAMDRLLDSVGRVLE
jgi:DNA-binding response OmpR family regulator